MFWWTDLQANLLDSNDIAIIQHRYYLGDPGFDRVSSVLITPTVKRILNDDLITMADSVHFSILRAGDDVTSFVHTMEVSNDFGAYTVLDHPDLNGNPSAIFVYSHNYEPETVYNDETTCAHYNGTHWTIRNEDGTDLPDQSSYNVVIPPPSNKVFVHTSDAGNSPGYYSYIDHPDLNANPAARFFVRHNLNLSTSAHDVNVGAFYQPFIEKWAIFNEDFSTMDAGLAFNVMIPDSDGDSVADHSDVCSGYDDNIDRDQNGTPDYCEDTGLRSCDYAKIIYQNHLPGEVLTYRADQSVTSDRVINSTAEITFGADRVQLNPGFEVKAGAIFETIYGCLSEAR